MREKRGMEPFQYPGKVDFRVFNSRMVAVQKKCANTKTGENPPVFDPGMLLCQSSASVGIASPITAGAHDASIRCWPLWRYRNCASPLVCSMYCSVTPITPNPYCTDRRKLIDDASGKYFVGQDTSPIRYPK